MTPHRIAGAVGGAAVSGAVVLLIGAVDGSAVTALLLIASARAAAAALADEIALGPWVALVPTWAIVVAVGTVRAGSVGLADVRGANAVAGPAVVAGEPWMVVAVWFAILAGLAAIAARASRTAWDTASARIDLLALVLELGLLVTLFSGPQTRALADGAAWAAGFAGGAFVIVTARARLLPGTLRRLSHAGAIVAIVIVAAGARA